MKTICRTQIKFLQAQLKHFGLNPTDWILHSQKWDQVEIRNMRDPNYIYRGHIIQKLKTKWEWSEISLISF